MDSFLSELSACSHNSQNTSRLQHLNSQNLKSPSLTDYSDSSLVDSSHILLKTHSQTRQNSIENLHSTASRIDIIPNTATVNVNSNANDSNPSSPLPNAAEYNTTQTLTWLPDSDLSSYFTSEYFQEMATVSVLELTLREGESPMDLPVVLITIFMTPTLALLRLQNENSYSRLFSKRRCQTLLSKR